MNPFHSSFFNNQDLNGILELVFSELRIVSLWHLMREVSSTLSQVFHIFIDKRDFCVGMHGEDCILGSESILCKYWSLRTRLFSLRTSQLMKNIWLFWTLLYWSHGLLWDQGCLLCSSTVDQVVAENQWGSALFEGEGMPARLSQGQNYMILTWEMDGNEAGCLFANQCRTQTWVAVVMVKVDIRSYSGRSGISWHLCCREHLVFFWIL